MMQTGCVFIVDDEPMVLRAFNRVLTANGLSVETFASASAFLDRSPYDGPACLVLDLSMPDQSGLEVQELLAQRGEEMPIVFLSGTSDVPRTAKAMRDGAADFLVKPVDEAQLRMPWCARWLSTYAGGAAVMKSGARPNAGLG